MIALIEAIHAGLFARKNILPNILAGIVVGIVTIPLSIAFAIASGVKPEVGIYTSIIAVLCGSIFGGSRVQISGPTGAFIGLLLLISEQFGFDGLQIATILAGIMLILLGVTHCGKVIKFIPEQVIIGFTVGIAINLLIGQFPNFCGLHCEKLSHQFLKKIYQISHALPSLDIKTTLISSISLIILMFNQRTIFRKIPASIMALLFGIITQTIFQFDSVATMGSAFGGMPQSLPHIQLPANVTFSRIYSLIPSAFAIAMLGAIESLLSAIIADRIIGTQHSSNQELIGQGIANIVCPIFGGIASTGSIARTASSIRAGGNSPLTGIVSSITLLCIVCFCAPLANNIPLATLAAIIFMVAINMIHLKTLVYNILHSPRLDAFTLIITCVLTILYGIVPAVNTGIVLSALILMYRLTDSANIQYNKDNDLFSNNDISTWSNNVAVYTISGPLFFGMIDKFERTLEQIPQSSNTLILNMQNVPFIDTAGLQALKNLIKKFEKNNKQVFIAEACPQVIQKLQRAQITDSTKEEIKNLSFKQAVNIAKSIKSNIQ